MQTGLEVVLEVFQFFLEAALRQHVFELAPGGFALLDCRCRSRT
jgi:hypothetical protein